MAFNLQRCWLQTAFHLCDPPSGGSGSVTPPEGWVLLGKCFRLWLLHGLDAEKECRAYPRIFVTYEELLGDWRATVDRISEGLDLQWPNRVQEVEKEVAAFLDPALRHHHRPAGITVQDPVLAELVAALHEALVRAAGKEESLSVELVSSLERRLEHERPTLGASLLRKSSHP